MCRMHRTLNKFETPFYLERLLRWVNGMSNFRKKYCVPILCQIVKTTPILTCLSNLNTC
jgi:hypothetical protein